MSDLTGLTVSELSERLTSREVSAVDVVQAHLDRIGAVDPQVNAFLTTNDRALDAAREVDARRASGEELGPLAGVPVSVKDLIVSTEMPTTAGSKILEGYTSPFDATVVQRLRRAGIVMVGKTNTDEFGMGSSTEHSAFGPSRNPWDLTRVPGGSSGGAAAATASCQAPFSLGTDTGGSIRQPAALCGVVGVKPTYGAVSRYGAISLASSLDQIGSLGRTVLDAALLQDVIIGTDARDANSLRHDWPSMAAAARTGATAETIRGKRIGVIRQLTGGVIQDGVAERFQRALELLEAQGAEIVDIDLPELAYAVAAYYLILPAEASSNLAKFDSVRFGLKVLPDRGPATSEAVMSATRTAGFGEEVKRRIILGTHVLSAGSYDKLFRNALRARTLVIRAFERAFESVDVMVSPSTPFTAQEIGKPDTDPMHAYLADATTIPASLAGIPAISVPVGVTQEDGLPVGVQVLAPAMEDARAFEAAAALEQLITARDGRPFWTTIPMLNGKATA